MTRVVGTLMVYGDMLCVASEMPEILMFPKARDMTAGPYDYESA